MNKQMNRFLHPPWYQRFTQSKKKNDLNKDNKPKEEKLTLRECYEAIKVATLVNLAPLIFYGTPILIANTLKQYTDRPLPYESQRLQENCRQYLDDEFNFILNNKKVTRHYNALNLNLEER